MNATVAGRSSAASPSSVRSSPKSLSSSSVWNDVAPVDAARTTPCAPGAGPKLEYSSSWCSTADSTSLEPRLPLAARDAFLSESCHPSCRSETSYCLPSSRYRLSTMLSCPRYVRGSAATSRPPSSTLNGASGDAGTATVLSARSSCSSSFRMRTISAATTIRVSLGLALAVKRVWEPRYTAFPWQNLAAGLRLEVGGQAFVL
jgi:hypothetical protein